MNRRRFGPFELQDRLGVGGMGLVYRAVYRKTGQQVALKILPPAVSANKSLVARFEREMAILKKLQHPHITKYYGGGKIGNQHFYAMQLMPGGTLEDELKRKGRLTWEQTLDYGIQICAALEHAHNHGIIHRDLKPANLFLGEGGKLVLGDFGIARDVDATAITAAGYTVGTYAYMAPEQITGKEPVSRKTDLYALGCVLFEMLTGRTPYEAETQPQLLYQHLHSEPPRVAELALDCPIWLEDIVLQLLAKDPADRPYDAPFVQMVLQEVPAKVAQHSSVATHVARGGQTAVARQTDAATLKASLKRRKKKKKKQAAPLYERTWFLAACLGLLIAAVTWSLWPASEEALFREAQKLMASDDPMHWQQAKDRYLLELLDRFPTGQYARQAQDYLDQVAAYQAERRMLRNVRLGRDPDCEGERLFVRGYRFEQFGDRLSAVEHYRSMVALLTPQLKKIDAAAPDADPNRAFVKLAQQRIQQITQAGDLGDRAELLNNALAGADELYRAGQTLKARTIWNSIVTLYGDNREFAPQVSRAQSALNGEFAAAPPHPQTSPDPPADTTPPSAALPAEKPVSPRSTPISFNRERP